MLSFVLGGGLVGTVAPETVNPLNWELLTLVVPDALEVLVTLALRSLEVIKPPRSFKFLTSAVDVTLSSVAERFTVIVEVAVPELTNELAGVMLPEFVRVLVAEGVVQLSATGILGP